MQKVEIIPINNLTLIYSPLNNLETASLGVFVRIGARFEDMRVKGIAHFLEHMVFKGTANYSHRNIKQEIEGRGGSLNAFTSQELSAYHANFLKKNFYKTCDILLDLVQNPLLKPRDINKERGVILEEIKMYNDLPSSRALMLLDSLLWKNHPLGQEIIGYKSTVGAIKRKDLESFRNKYYIPKNTVISLCGALRVKDVVKFIGQKTKQTNKSFNLHNTKPLPIKNPRVIIEKKALNQSHLCIGFRSYPYSSKNRIALRLINIILGANMSSRLFEELREKRSLCYDVSTETRFYKDTGGFIVHLGLDESKVIVALGSILKELDKLKKKKPLNKELSRAKDYLLGQIAMSLEVPYGRMPYLASSYINLGKIEYFANLKKSICAITPSQITQIAKDIFKFNQVCISAVGNLKDDLESKIERILK